MKKIDRMSCRGLSKETQVFLDNNDDYVYIGRRTPYQNFNKSKWCNPYSVKKYGRDGCIARYKAYLENNQELLSHLPELYNKTLVCWCPLNEPCHGDVLIDMIKKEV